MLDRSVNSHAPSSNPGRGPNGKSPAAMWGFFNLWLGLRWGYVILNFSGDLIEQVKELSNFDIWIRTKE